MNRIIKYYDKNFNLTNNKNMIFWVSNTILLNKDTKFEKIYNISTRELEEYILYKNEKIGICLFYKDKEIMVENAKIYSNNIGMTIRKDYGILEIDVRDIDGSYEGICCTYELNGKRIEEKLWMKDKLVENYYYENEILKEYNLSDNY